ncbi:Exopolysaccharide synthesis, ExoD [Pirellulimonas nuda]|uniref:Exopolysaccharide synthesis, ExoD n=1 Tax=Pirellulimonas nuda TaxID=2528009 RepID=A0A518D729_9BACT|nr:exopolysaccharide biosynthesis protein [Pirellulimonas nuda]QDU87293.1 Exopolysaccharide synthesis, ExoD [Pirellulimonas nuda]
MADEEPRELTDVIDDLKEKSQEDGQMSAQDALDEFAGRLFGPLLVVPGLVTLIPVVGAIPLVPTTMGVWVVLVAGQTLAGREYPWLPGVIADRSVDAEKFRESMEKFRPWAEWIDKFTKPRLTWLVKGPGKYALAALCIVLALTLPPLEFLPMACAAPGGAILLIGLAITAHDGLLALIAVGLSLLALFLVSQAWSAFAAYFSG